MGGGVQRDVHFGSWRWGRKGRKEMTAAGLPVLVSGVGA